MPLSSAFRPSSSRVRSSRPRPRGIGVAKYFNGSKIVNTYVAAPAQANHLYYAVNAVQSNVSGLAQPNILPNYTFSNLSQKGQTRIADLMLSLQGTADKIVTCSVP